MTETVRKSEGTKSRSTAKAKPAAEVTSTVKLNEAQLNGAAEAKAAKPRKTAAKKAKVVVMAAPAAVSQEQVAQLAHRFWFERGCQHGHHEEDWFRAEQELRGKAS